MKMKLMTLALTMALVGANALPTQVNTSQHTHLYTQRIYYKTTQDGSYSHTYIVGVNPITNVVIYGECLVMCETEYYTYRCEREGCYATDGKLYPEPVTTHTSCSQ